MGITLFLTLAFCIFEFVGGRLSGSLALMADAGHMLTDVAALGLACFAGWMASRRATPKMSYGYYRIEVLSALINGATLITLAVLIVKEAFERFHQPSSIHTTLMLAVAAAGFVFDLFNGFLLHRFTDENINIRGAFFHVAADALSSLGTIAAALVIQWTGWTAADPLVSCFIALLIIVSAWRLLKDVVEVLLEATPAHIHIRSVEEAILSIAGLQALHDLHIWSISTGKIALSAHLEVRRDANRDQILHEVNDVLNRRFRIDHTTLQIETPEQRTKEKTHFHD